jgi:glycosyltransferase involved in cell wall biosynthesis
LKLRFRAAQSWPTTFQPIANDAASLAENIRLLNSDRAMCRAYAELAYTRARERFTTKRMIDEYLQLYRSLVSVGSAAA